MVVDNNVEQARTTWNNARTEQKTPETTSFSGEMSAFQDIVSDMDEKLGVGTCFDMTGRELVIGGRAARLWVVNGYADDAVLERAISGWLPIRDLNGIGTLEAFVAQYVTVSEAEAETDMDKAVTAVFSGKTLLVIDGYPGGVLMDAKQFPLRGIEEPDTSKVLRGSHDGFVESIMKNAALLRRRISTARASRSPPETGTKPWRSISCRAKVDAVPSRGTYSP